MSSISDMLDKVEEDERCKNAKEEIEVDKLQAMQLEVFRTYAAEAHRKLMEGEPEYLRAAGGSDLTEGDIWNLALKEMSNRQVGDARTFIGLSY